MAGSEEKRPVRISVIVPVYNVEKYLAKCVESVLKQSFTDWELILVDDGSKDMSGRICDGYAVPDGKVRVIHQENRGLSGARNTGIEAARGEYLIFLDSDDYWDPSVLAELYRTVREEKADMALFPLLYEDAAGRELPAPALSPLGLSDGESVLEALCLKASPQLVTAVNRLSRRSLWETFRFPEGRFHEDEFTAHRLYAACEKIVLLPRPYYHYLQRDGSISRAERPDRCLDRIDALLDRCEFLEDKEVLIRSVLRFLMHWYLSLLSESKAEDIRHCTRWKDILGRLRRNAAGREALFSRRERLAIRFPFLWQRLHALNHRKAGR